MPPTIQAYLSRLANTSIGPSTLRNQGAPGVTSAVREFLASLDIGRFANERQFPSELDSHTDALMRALPAGAQNWGTARKSLNLFLGECYYHRFVSEHYNLQVILPLLEVPLDSQVAGLLYRLARTRKDHRVPPWPGIRQLTPPVGGSYQRFASVFASGLGPGWARIHIDLIAWQRL